jgi:hypothetical protein
LLPGIWLLRLAPLDPLLTVVPVDFAALQRQEAAAVPHEAKTDAQRRRAELPLSVYIEETLHFNVFSATGPLWDRLLSGLESQANGTVRDAFFRPDEEPMGEVLDKLAAGGGTTFISFSRPGGDRHYRVDRHGFTRRDFEPGAGFTGTPAPPASLLFPFRNLGHGSLLAGFGFFLLLAGARHDGVRTSLTALEALALAGALLFFLAPLVFVGGSVQALTRAPFLTIPCWILAAVQVHVFAGPARNAPDPTQADPASSPESAGRRARLPVSALFLREGLAFLAVALGPLAFLVSASMILWNR